MMVLVVTSARVLTLPLSLTAGNAAPPMLSAQTTLAWFA